MSSLAPGPRRVAYALPAARRLGALATAVGVALAAFAGAGWGAPLPDDIARHSPNGRFGTLPTPHTAPGMRNSVVDVGDLGNHDYQTHPKESQGILYTCRAGFVDMDHVRDAADWTAYLRQRFLEALMQDKDGVRFSGEDRDVSFLVRLRRLDPADKAAWAGPVATQLARRYAFLLLTWHEVLTWFGYRKVFLFPEQVSAFSYEDTVSHLVGLEVADTALAASLPWGEAVDLSLADVLHELGGVPKDGTWKAFDLVKDRWYDSGSAWPSNAFVRKRDLDIGLEGQGVRPWIVSGVPGCGREPATVLQVDRLASLADGRFADIDVARLLPGPSSYWDRLFPQGRPQEGGRPVESLDPKVHLAPVMAEVRRQVIQELGPDADRP